MADGDITLKNLTDPVEDLMQYLPPASAAYRSYIAPGFWSAGSTPSNTPNPVMGDNDVAKPASGEYSYVPPPVAPQQSMLSQLTSTSPKLFQASGTSADEKAANHAKEVGDAGEVTDFSDFAKSVGLGLSLTSPTGIAGLAATAALNAAGVPPEYTDPLGDIFGNPSGPFDIRSNYNARPGWRGAYDDAIRGGATPQGALDQAAIRTGGSARPSGAPAVPGSSAAAVNAAPAPTPVTQANSVTGFQRQTAPTAPAAPAAPTGSGALASTTINPATAGYTPSPTSPTPTGQPSGYKAGAGSVNANNSYGGVMSSNTPNDLTNRDRLGTGAAPGAGSTGGASNAGGGVGSNAAGRGFSDGGAVTNDQPDEADYWTPYSTRMQGRWQMERASRADGGVITPPTGADMFRSATQSTMPADVGQTPDPYQDQRYNPDPSMTETGGVTDGVPAQLTPGEFVITREAAQQLDPEVLAALNDPAVVGQINQLIAGLLNGGEDPSAMNGGDDESDDGHGLGIAGRTSTPNDPRGGSMLRGLSRLG